MSDRAPRHLKAWTSLSTSDSDIPAPMKENVNAGPLWLPVDVHRTVVLRTAERYPYAKTCEVQEHQYSL